MKTKVAALFATRAGAQSGHPPAYWSGWAQANGADNLEPHERFQLLWHQIETPEDWDRLKPRVLGATGALARELSQLSKPTAFVRATDQRSGLLGPAFHLMNSFGRSDDLLEIMAQWYGIPDETRLRGGALFVCATFEHGTAYLGAQSQLLPRDGAAQVAELTRTTNAMLGLTLTIQGEEIDVEIPARPAHPDPDAASDFASAVERAYSPAELQPETMAGSTALIAFPGLPPSFTGLDVHAARRQPADLRESADTVCRAGGPQGAALGRGQRLLLRVRDRSSRGSADARRRRG